MAGECASDQGRPAGRRAAQSSIILPAALRCCCSRAAVKVGGACRRELCPCILQQLSAGTPCTAPVDACSRPCSAPSCFAALPPRWPPQLPPPAATFQGAPDQPPPLPRAPCSPQALRDRAGHPGHRVQDAAGAGRHLCLLVHSALQGRPGPGAGAARRNTRTSAPRLRAWVEETGQGCAALAGWPWPATVPTAGGLCLGAGSTVHGSRLLPCWRSRTPCKGTGSWERRTPGLPQPDFFPSWPPPMPYPSKPIAMPPSPAVAAQLRCRRQDLLHLPGGR